MKKYFCYSLLFCHLFAFGSTISTINTTRYLLDKNSTHEPMGSYKDHCIDNLSDDVLCTILRTDIANDWAPNKCFFFVLNEFRRDQCYYLDCTGFYYQRPIDPLPGSYTIVYPYLCNSSITNIPTSDSYGNLASQSPKHGTNSLMELENDARYEKCMIMTNEMCRANEEFSRSLDSLIRGDKFNVLSIFARKSPLIDKINYSIHKDLDVYVPSSQKFQDYLLSVITDQFYIHKNEMLKKLEYSLKFRECVLLNELDILFFNITQFPLNLYKDIKMLNIYIMDGYNHLTYVAFTKLQEIWSEIEKSDLQSVYRLIERFKRVYDIFQKDLKAPLKFIMDPSIYGEILSNSSSYSNFYSKHLETNKIKLTRLEIDKLTTDSNEFLKKLSSLLPKQCQAPSTYGPLSTSVFFKSSENKINSI